MRTGPCTKADAKGRLRQETYAARGGTEVIRSEIVDPTVEPAPLPVSDAPPAEVAAAPALAPDEDEPGPTSTERPAAVVEPEPEVTSPELPDEPAIPPSAPRLVTPAAPVTKPVGLTGALLALAPTVLEQLARHAQEVQTLDAWIDNLKGQLEEARAQVATVEGILQGARDKRADTHATLAQLLGEPSPTSVAGQFVQMVDEMVAMGSSAPSPALPGPAKTRGKGPEPTRAPPVIPGLRQQDRALLAMPDKGETTVDALCDHTQIKRQSLYALLSVMVRLGHLTHGSVSGTYTLTAEGRRERASIEAARRSA